MGHCDTISLGYAEVQLSLRLITNKEPPQALLLLSGSLSSDTPSDRFCMSL